jgi:hypothetical protein
MQNVKENLLSFHAATRWMMMLAMLGFCTPWTSAMICHMRHTSFLTTLYKDFCIWTLDKQCLSKEWYFDLVNTEMVALTTGLPSALLMAFVQQGMANSSGTAHPW